ncbi:MAG: GNAT family N-acetyltransferase [Tumebacillaceae bacterium]
MAQVKLVPQNLQYADRIFELVMNPHVSGALGLSNQSSEDTKRFIRNVIEKEEQGLQISRVILDEQGDVAGITDLMFINREEKHAHIGSWIRYDYWGKGYNQAAKEAILTIAFQQLGLEIVFAGARATNIRSQKAQEKLPYFSLHVQDEFPEQHLFLENKEKQPCVLHAVRRADFLQHLQQKAAMR